MLMTSTNPLQPDCIRGSQLPEDLVRIILGTDRSETLLVFFAIASVHILLCGGVVEILIPVERVTSRCSSFHAFLEIYSGLGDHSIVFCITGETGLGSRKTHRAEDLLPA
jgi:hypothetical protein